MIRGQDCDVAIYDETTYGQDPGTPNGILLPRVSCGVQAQQNLLQPNTRTSVRVRSAPGKGNMNVSGPINLEVASESIGPLIKHAIGGSVVTTGTGPYTHTMKPGDLPTSFVVEKDYSRSGVSFVEKFNGCRVDSMQINCPAEGYVTAAFNILGASYSTDTAPLDATLTDNGHDGFTAFEASIQEGGGAIAIVKSVQFNLANNLDPNQFVIGGGGIRAALPEGFADISGNLTAIFEDATLLNKAINGTASSLLLTLSRGTGDGSAGNEFVSIEVPDLEYTLQSAPDDVAQGLTLSLSFQGYANGADLGLEVILKNQLTTL